MFLVPPCNYLIFQAGHETGTLPRPARTPPCRRNHSILVMTRASTSRGGSGPGSAGRARDPNTFALGSGEGLSHSLLLMTTQELAGRRPATPSRGRAAPARLSADRGGGPRSARRTRARSGRRPPPPPPRRSRCRRRFSGESRTRVSEIERDGLDHPPTRTSTGASRGTPARLRAPHPSCSSGRTRRCRSGRRWPGPCSASGPSAPSGA
jgi:hypothetical protein